MLWDGRTVLTVYGYRPVTTPAIKWTQLSNGNWTASDRTSVEDVYESEVIFQGTFAELTDLETSLGNNRTDFICFCSDGEEIFGADISYTTQFTVTVTKYGTIKQTGFKLFQMAIKLRMITPVFKTAAADFSKLRLSSHANTRTHEFDITKKFSYNQIGYSVDHEVDAQTFSGHFTQTTAEMGPIRRYLLTTARTAAVSFPSFGNITYPFGYRAGNSSFNVKVIKWADTGRTDFNNWGLRMTFARQF